MNNDTIFLTCPKCHKTKAFSYYYEITYVCDCGYSYENCNLYKHEPINPKGGLDDKTNFLFPRKEIKIKDGEENV